MTDEPKLLPCPFCGGEPELVDDRLNWYVRCTNHPEGEWIVVCGKNVRWLDHIGMDAATDAEADKMTSEAADKIDWDALRQSAIDGWNRRDHADALVAAAMDRLADKFPTWGATAQAIRDEAGADAQAALEAVKADAEERGLKSAISMILELYESEPRKDALDALEKAEAALAALAKKEPGA